MILFFRKYLAKILLALSFCAVLGGVWFFFRELGLVPSAPQLLSARQIWWFLYGGPEGFDKRAPWLILMGFGLYSLLFGFAVFRRIKKNPSPQLAFLYLFIFTFSLHMLRLLYLLPQQMQPQIEGELITRVAYFARFFGLTAFLSASLFTTGLPIQKFGSVLLVTLLISFSLSIIIPINTIELSSALLFRIAEEKSIALFCLSVEVITLLNYLAAAIKQARGEFFRLILFCLMILGGFEGLFFLYPPFLIPGFLSLTAGTLLYIRTSQKLFLWS